MSLAQQSEKLLQTLETWRYLWGRAVAKIPSDHQKWLGVAKNVPNVEYLSRRIIEVAVTPEARSSRYLQRMPSHHVRELHEFIERFIART